MTLLKILLRTDFIFKKARIVKLTTFGVISFAQSMLIDSSLIVVFTI